MNRERPLFIAVMVAVFLAVAISVAAVVLWWQARAAECQRTIETRADARAMFEYLAGTAEDQTDPRVIAFRAELNRRLPALSCVGSQPIPLTGDT